MEFNFPPLPLAKIYGHDLTPEQCVMLKLMRGHRISLNEEAILSEVLIFYKKTYPYFKSIDLSKLDDKDAAKIIVYFKSVFNFPVFIQNVIIFQNVYRVTTIKNNYLESGKVRDVRYISYPPQNVIEELGVYGRCNSPKSTAFYCSFEPGVAVLETKPQTGQRIIISHWYNENEKDFFSYPITNNKTIENDSLKSATLAFQERMKYNHPLFAQILDLYFDFVSSEFVKDIRIENPKKYEYLFSAVFSDEILENSFMPVDHPVETLKHYDCIIYPSIAINYKSENLAIIPSSVSKLRPIFLEESIVVKTMYDNPDLSDDKLPILRKVLRTSIRIENNKIIWNDD